jgi:hypothetical protein
MKEVDGQPCSNLEPAFVTLDRGDGGAPPGLAEPCFVLDFLKAEPAAAASPLSRASTSASSPFTTGSTTATCAGGSSSPAEATPEAVLDLVPPLPGAMETTSPSPAAALKLELDTPQRRCRVAPCDPVPVGPLATTPSTLAPGLSIPADAAVSAAPSESAQAPLPVKVLRLGDMMPEPPCLGSPERPTQGSSNHHLGTCKPCAFVGKPGGCQSGVECKFCHLCEPGEKQRRRKGRQLVQKAVQLQTALLLQGATAAPYCGQVQMGGMVAPGAVAGGWSSPPYAASQHGLLQGWGAVS